ncbi:SRPBCC family protein [Leptospira idonii]|uniref:SRPBCC domain-containing protein n=1 Tax=Leptospira idonii TaxID=1193500 RepID=A0A4R9M0Q5_9LEPT|nr:SRPBCC domain-containing protein [Leptospira idonii]TGN19622.1 SRPBCC domain-containing protein [Leptospira idonii]
MRETRSVFDFNEPIERLWSAITVYEVLTHWLADEVRGRPKEGGDFSWTWKLGIEGDFTTHGTYKKIVPGKELIMEWKDHPAGDIFLQLLFESAAPGKSRLTVVNGGYPNSDAFDVWMNGAKEGWEEQVTHLVSFLKENPDFTKFAKKT